MMKRTIISAAALVAIASAVTPLLTARSSKTDIARNLSVFSEIYKELQTNYVDTLDATKTMRNAIDAMLGNIDPYTEYYSPEEQDRLTSISSGEYAGIGSVIMKRDTSIILSEPQWNSPARKAGVRHGDVLLAINGEALTAQTTTQEASSRLKGQAGTDLTITVRRPYDADSIKTFAITRGTISIDAIPYYGFVDDGIGYISIATFSEKTASDFADALATLRAEKPLRGLIIDLRGNGGGLLQSAVQVASNFVPKGTDIVTLRGRDTKTPKTYKTTRQPSAPELPLVVLVDDGTASSSEILSGSLQDLDRAVIVGERTYGKGLVQTPRPLPYGSMMKVTTGRYYLPSGRLIQAIDYSHRASDGSVERIPDSLTNVFHTRIGREVRDGGGITPEVVIERPEGNRLLYTVQNELWAYDFGTKTANTTTTVPDVETWEMSDSLFAEFKKFIDPEKFRYDRATEAGIKYLREAIKAEGYENDSVNATIAQLDSLLHHDLQTDLDINRDMLKRIIESDLSARWFSPADIIRREIRDNAVVRQATDILNDPRKYGAYLAAPRKEVNRK